LKSEIEIELNTETVGTEFSNTYFGHGFMTTSIAIEFSVNWYLITLGKGFKNRRINSKYIFFERIQIGYLREFYLKNKNLRNIERHRRR
jgi:hypothetical protein